MPYDEIETGGLNLVMKNSLSSDWSPLLLLHVPFQSCILSAFCVVLVFISFSLQYKPPDFMPKVYENLPMPPTYRDAIVNGMVFVHQTLHQANSKVSKRGGRTMAITPRHYLDFINHYVRGNVVLFFDSFNVANDFRVREKTQRLLTCKSDASLMKRLLID